MHAIKKTFSLFRIKTVQWIIVLFAVYTLAGFLVVSPIIKFVLSKKLSEQLHREVTIKSAIFNPYVLSLYLKGIAVNDRDKSETLFSLDELYLNLQIASALKKGLIIKEVKVIGPYINVVRYKDTLYNFSDLLEKDKAKQSPKIQLIKSKKGNLNITALVPPEEDKTSNEETKEDGRYFLIEVDEIIVTDGRFVFSEASLGKVVQTKLEHIELRGKDLSTVKDKRSNVSLSLAINNKGSFSTDGSISINPVSADLKLNLQDIDIIPLQPYFSEKVNILFTGGKFMTEGNFTFDYSEAGEINAAYEGKASLLKFTSVDKVKANHFLKWNSLYLSDIDFKYNPLSITISEVSLADFYSRLIVNSDGTLNVQGIVKDEKAKSESPPPDKDQARREAEQKSSTAAQIRINTVTLQAGTVNFSDKHIKPNYSANLSEIGGRISGLSSEEGTFANVVLRGKLENYAPIEIMGTINPLGKDLFVDLKVDFNDMDLSPLTPYANKYIGHNIQKGKLSLDLKYLIEKKKLDSQNNVFLDQFTLGEKVESPDATKLPVKFAISLLKNSKGEISLDLPVSGNIDEPGFNIGKIIIKMFVNLLVKAASSPFKLLGALVGGGEELSYIDFDYGKSGISEAEKAKLNKLVKALSDRPALMIDIEGHVDTEKDMEGLRQYTFDKKLKTQKLKEMVKKGQTVVPVDEIIIGPEEYEKYLEIAYKEEKFPKPRNILGFSKKLPPSEMEKLIFAYIDLNDNDLRLLASRRALNVKDYLLKSRQIDTKRIFLIEPESLQPEEKEKLKNSRVDFRLK